MTDHHAIIPTGFIQALTDMERRVFDLIARRFIAVFYPDCKGGYHYRIGEVDQIGIQSYGKADSGSRVARGLCQGNF